KSRAGGQRRLCQRAEALWSGFQDELPGGEVVVRAGVDPEQLGVALHLGKRVGIRGRELRPADDGLEHIAHVEVVRVTLVVKNIAPRDGGAVQMPDQLLLIRRQRRKSVR